MTNADFAALYGVATCLEVGYADLSFMRECVRDGFGKPLPESANLAELAATRARSNQPDIP